MNRQAARKIPIARAGNERSLRFVRHTLGVAALALHTLAAGAQLPEIPLVINGHRLTAEVAASDETRMQGLMHRRILPESRGMLFVFRETGTHAMWMMNTYIPLSVAFLDERGLIINIADMQPHTRDTHAAAKPAKFALEVNQGWFAKRGVKPGARIEGLERVPPAK
jgi:uncharacterized membrane protein (UPF0127 family)